jgi:hypothetical protein
MYFTWYIQGVSKPMSQTFPGYSPPTLKQKSSYQHGSKSELVPRYRLPSMCRYPFEYYIRCSKCWPFATTYPLWRHIMHSLTHSSWPGRFLMVSNVATMGFHNWSTVVTGVEQTSFLTIGVRGPRYRPVTPDPLPREMVIQVLACYAAEMLIAAFLGFLHSSRYLETCSLLDPCR